MGAGLWGRSVVHRAQADLRSPVITRANAPAKTAPRAKPPSTPGDGPRYSGLSCYEKIGRQRGNRGPMVAPGSALKGALAPVYPIRRWGAKMGSRGSASGRDTAHGCQERGQ